MIDFSINGYQQLLNLAKQNGYQCKSFEQGINVVGSNLSILIRHDIDFSLEYAFKMAQIESQFGLKATYFVMLRSPVYNLWSRQNTLLLWQIRDLGHDIGLHFDAEFSEQTGQDPIAQIKVEIEVLSSLVGSPVHSFSLHQPTPRIIEKEIQITGLINTYHPDQLSTFEYISDSNRNWRGKRVESVLNEKSRNIQLLTHPMWWISSQKSTEDCWDEVIANNFYREQRQILQTERAYGPKRRLLLERIS